MNDPFGELPKNHFGAILVDPPWRFEAWSGKGTARAADNHYRTMTMAELANLPVEKFPYLIRNAVECMPEQEVVILLGGGGARLGAVGFARDEARRCQTKRITVLTVDEFPRWVRDEFVRAKETAA